MCTVEWRRGAPSLVPESARERTFSCTPARILARGEENGHLFDVLPLCRCFCFSPTTLTPGPRVDTGRRAVKTRGKKKRRAHAMTRDQHEDDPRDTLQSSRSFSRSLSFSRSSLPLLLASSSSSSSCFFLLFLAASLVRRFCSSLCAPRRRRERYCW